MGVVVVVVVVVVVAFLVLLQYVSAVIVHAWTSSTHDVECWCLYVAFVVIPVLLITDVAVIQSLGEQIKVRQQVIATATIYFKRFYARYVRLQAICHYWNNNITLFAINYDIFAACCLTYLLDKWNWTDAFCCTSLLFGILDILTIWCQLEFANVWRHICCQ